MQSLNVSRSPNRLLAGLSRHSRERLIASSDLVNLTFGEVLCESGGPVRHAYFPTAGFVSLIARLDDGARLEIGMIGDEGMLGAPLILGTITSIQDLVVQGKGTAWRMPATDFRSICAADPALRALLDRYTYVLMSQLAQTAACTHFHSLDARLARWLLMTRDRSHSNSFFVTHEFLAYMLGVRRAGVSTAASVLRDEGLIRYQRGKVTVLKSSGLERISCVCYRQANDTYRRILGSH
jgi:CRP-like cAMP-binding protein